MNPNEPVRVQRNDRRPAETVNAPKTLREYVQAKQVTTKWAGFREFSLVNDCVLDAATWAELRSLIEIHASVDKKSALICEARIIWEGHLKLVRKSREAEGCFRSHQDLAL